mmetsp:Transcript_32676/g.29552  ORF Transcript_32676/g.29552 Transcript_32676/m.29552 type:complete len:190 (+) Transcript_32676:38-607(+)
MIVRWNFLILVLCSTFDEIVLFSHLEFFYSTAAGGGMKAFSIILALIMIVLMVLLLLKTFQIVRLYQKLKTQIRPGQSLEDGDTFKSLSNVHEYYSVLFIGFKPKSFFTQCYMLVFLLRALFFGIIIAIFHEYPMFQITSILVLNILMIAYIVVVRPFKKTQDFIEVCLYEAIILVANCAVLKLLVMDR